MIRQRPLPLNGTHRLDAGPGVTRRHADLVEALTITTGWVVVAFTIFLFGAKAWHVLKGWL